MKTLFKSCLVLGVAFLLGSCVKSEINEELEYIRLYSSGVTERVDAKAAIDVQGNQIADGAAVGVFVYDTQTSGFVTNGNNNRHTVSYENGFALTSNKAIAYPGNNAVNIHAYAPYSETARLNAHTFSVANDQSTDEGYIASDLLHSTLNDVTASKEMVGLNFSHLMSKIKFYIYPNDKGVNLKGATVTLHNVAKSVTFNPQTGALSGATINENDNTIIMAEFGEDQVDEYTCAALFVPHTFVGGKTFLTITEAAPAEGEAKTYTVAMPQNKEFKTGMSYTYGIKVKTQMEMYPTAITNWREGHEELNVGGGDIQSMTFMSEYAEEYAIAYYNFVDNNDDGYKDTKEGTETFELNYLVRPAEMAQRFTNPYFWNNQMRVIGYYAKALTTKSSYGFDYPMTKSFDNQTFQKIISNVEATEDGILTVTVLNSGSNDLSQDFYNKLTSAKIALSIDDEETNYTTRYVQLFPKDSDPTVYAEAVQLNVYQASLTTGGTLQLKGTVVPTDVTTTGVTWSSSDETIAIVDQNGLVTANQSKEGDAVITCTANMRNVNGQIISEKCNISVTFAQPEVYILNKEGNVEIGQSLQLKYAALPLGVYIPQDVEWKSSKESLATVDEKGVVTGVSYNIINQSEVTTDGAEPKYEAVTITLTADGEYKATITLNITPKFPKSIEFTDGYGSSLNMKVGEKLEFSAKVGPDDLEENYKGINWWIQEPNEASLNKGAGSVTDYVSSYSFTASKEGTYVITPRHSSTNFYQNIYAHRYVYVTPVYVESLAFAESSHTMKQGVAWTPVMNYNPENPTYKGFTLSSNRPDLITINGTTITANPDYEMATESETVTITATATGASEDGTYATATCQVTVNRVINIIGWYYCANGNWYKTLSEVSANGTSAIGVIFSMENPTEQDAYLASKKPGCTHGYAIALGVAQTQYKLFYENPESVTDWLQGNNTYANINDYNGSSIINSNLKGYNNTAAFNYWYTHNSWTTANRVPGYKFMKLNGTNSPSDKPSGASEWFIPSAGEINAIYNNRDKVETSLSEANGVSVNNMYWISSMNGMNYYCANPYTKEFVLGTNISTRDYRYIIAF